MLYGRDGVYLRTASSTTTKEEHAPIRQFITSDRVKEQTRKDPLTATEGGALAAEEQALSNPAQLNEGFPPEIRLAAESG